MQDTKSKRAGKERKTGQIIRIEQEQLNRHLDKVVRGTVEACLNAHFNSMILILYNFLDKLFLNSQM